MQSAISQVVATLMGKNNTHPQDSNFKDNTSKYSSSSIAVSKNNNNSSLVKGNYPFVSSSARNITPRTILLAGTILSFILALFLSIFINFNSKWIACNILMVPDCDIYLKLLTYLFPFCSISACICGYQYGLENAKPPAIAGIIEQITRILFVFIVQGFFSDKEICCQIAVYGLTVGEFFGFLYNMSTIKNKTFNKRKNKISLKESFKLLLPVFISLTSIKLTISLLHSVESIFIPASLVKYGYTVNEALSVYGIYSGMAMPFIMFPATITMAISTMLLPAVSKAHSSGNKKQIKKLIRRTSYFCLVTGMAATVFFLLFGNICASLFFHNELAGRYLTVMSFLCPFLYLNMTYSSILNGLGKPHMTFVITVVCTLIKILSLIFFVPKYGMIAYIAASLVAEALLCVMLRHYCG